MARALGPASSLVLLTPISLVSPPSDRLCPPKPSRASDPATFPDASLASAVTCPLPAYHCQGRSHPQTNQEHPQWWPFSCPAAPVVFSVDTVRQWGVRDKQRMLPNQSSSTPPPLEAHRYPSLLLKTGNSPWACSHPPASSLPPQWFPHSSSNRSDPILPQGLCICCSLCLDQHPGLLISQVPAQTSPPQMGLPRAPHRIQSCLPNLGPPSPPGLSFHSVGRGQVTLCSCPYPQP